MQSCELVSFVTALSCGIAKCYPKEELPLLIAVLSQLTATLATILEAEDSKLSNDIAPSINPSDTLILSDNNN